LSTITALSAAQLGNIASLVLAVTFGVLGFIAVKGRATVAHDAADETKEQAETLHIIEASREARATLGEIAESLSPDPRGPG